MSRRCAVVALWCLLGSAGATADVSRPEDGIPPDPLDIPGLAGLVVVPGILGARDSNDTPVDDVPLYPTARSHRPIGHLRLVTPCSPLPRGAGCVSYKFDVETGGTSRALPTLEYEYEEAAAIVLGRAHGRYRIAIEGGSAWIDVRATSRFFSIPTLLHDRMLSVRDAAAGTARRSPGGRRVPDVTSWPQARLTRIVRWHGAWWVRIARERNTCVDPNAPDEPHDAAWLPFLDAHGHATVFFYSRGC